MLRPETGESASPRMGLSGEAGRGGRAAKSPDFDLRDFSCDSGLACATFGSVDDAAAFALPTAADFAAGLAPAADARSCFSSLSSCWIRCSIFSSFLSSMSLALSSAAYAPPELRIDIAVAASKADRPAHRRRSNLNTNGSVKACNGIVGPHSLRRPAAGKTGKGALGKQKQVARG